MSNIWIRLKAHIKKWIDPAKNTHERAITLNHQPYQILLYMNLKQNPVKI